MHPTPLPARPAASAAAVADAPFWTRARQRLIAALLAMPLVTLALPVSLVAIPPLLDYPNHLVRMWLIAGGAEIEPLSRMYAVSWSSAYTNVGIDYLAAVLGLVVPALTLGSFLVLLAVVLPPLGAVALNRALFGGFHWWQIGFVLLAWTATLIAGFLNFQIGIGCALLAAALEPRVGRWRPSLRVLARAGLATALLLVHMFALFYYCALLAGLAFGPAIAGLRSRRELMARARAVIATVAPAAAPAVVFVALAPALPGAHVDAAGNAPLWDLSVLGKLYVLLSPIATYNLWLDLACAAAVVVPSVLALVAGRVQAHAGLLIASANGHPSHWSYPVLAIMWRHVFVPNLFWAAGKQPLIALWPWNQISLPEDGPHAAQALLDPRQTPPHFANWRQRYDYVLLLNADVGRIVDLARLPELVLVRDEGFARLYRVAGKPTPEALAVP